MPSPEAGPAAPPQPTPPPHLIVPFAYRRAPACEAAWADLKLPQLDALLARLAPVHEDRGEDDSLSPPHERALARALGLSAPDGCLPWAALAARRAGLPQADGAGWALLTLCHWQVGMSEVVLHDPEALDLRADEAEALRAIAQPYFEDDGVALFPTGQPGRWLARGALFEGLPTAAPERAIGQPLAPWLPMQEAARPLRRLQNEMQMLFYTAPANDDRTARGQMPVNAFWVSGTGPLAPDQPDAAPPSPAPTLEPSLRAPALHDDGAAWAAAWQTLDAGPITALLAASRQGQPVQLTLCGDRGARSWASAPGGWGGRDGLQGLKRRILGVFGRQRPSSGLVSL